MNRRRMGKFTFGFVVVLSAIADPAAPQDLPLGHKNFAPSPARPVGWRGDGSGVFPGATPPVQWNGPKSENMLWSVACPHVTYASPIVVGNRVITLADPHTILCYDADSGKLLWHNVSDTVDLLCKTGDARQIRRLFGLYDFYFSSQGLKQKLTGTELDARTEAMAQFKAAGVPPPPKDSPGNETGAWDYNPFFAKYGLWSPDRMGLPRTMATPVSDGKRVWVYWMSNAAACYDVADGKLVWMKFLGELRGCPDGLFFPSPVLADGPNGASVLVVKGADMLRGLDAATGEVRWEMPFKVGKYSCDTPLRLDVDGKPVIVTWEGLIIRPRDGKVLAAKVPVKLPEGVRGTFHRGNSAFPIGPGAYAMQVQCKRQVSFSAVRLKWSGPDAVSAEALWGAQVTGYDDDDGTSCASGGLLYANNGWDLVELATGKVHPRTLQCPTSGYPGVSVAGGYVYNFDEAGSCGVTAPGADGKVVAVNHLLAGYMHEARLGGVTKGGNRSLGDKVARKVDWWKQVEQQAAAGVIGWVGRRQNLTLGEMTADPFFQGGRIYLRTYTHLYCIGAK